MAAPAGFGGLERVLVGLVEGLAEAGALALPILVLTPDAPEPGWVADWRARGVSPVVVRVGAREYGRERRAVAEILKRERIGVLHTHGYRPDVVHGALPPRGVKTVSTVHGFTRESWRVRLYEAIQRRALRRFDAVVAVSRPLERELIASGVGRRRLHLIRNSLHGSAAAVQRDAAREQLVLPAQAPIVGWVGRLSQEKGPDVFVEAALASRAEGTVFAIIGEGPMRESLERRVAEADAVDRVRFLGARADAGNLMTAFDLLALSSRTEGTPMVLLEAARAGIPFIATAVGGVPDLVGDCGRVLVRSDAPDELAGRIDDALAGDRHFASDAAAVNASIQEAHSAPRWISAHLGLYKSLTSS